MRARRFSVLVIFLSVAIGVPGCGSSDDISGVYRGTETTQLIRGGSAERGAARTAVMVEAVDDALRVTVAGCELTLPIAVAGVAELLSSTTCTMSSDREAAITLSLELGEATWGDGEFGLTLLGTAGDGARWEYTFAGSREEG
ncbi:MAG: hypothetical protein AAGA23_19505 [Pseudomonadota bacterium]